MALENIVTSLELSQKLEQIGIKQNSLFYWIDPKFVNENDLMIKGAKCFISSGEWLALEPKADINYFSAYTAQELWDMIKDSAVLLRLIPDAQSKWLKMILATTILPTRGQLFVESCSMHQSLANCLAQLIIAQHEAKNE